MLHECSKKERGFTLIEVTVSLTILVVVLVLSMTLLWSMQGFAKRQKQFAEPRQTARRAMDYVASNLRAATDGNFDGGNPNAIIVYYNNDATLTQATYNNIADPTLAEPGTDIMTFGKSEGGGNIRISTWNGPDDVANASNLYLYYSKGCSTSDGYNLLMFMQETGCSGNSCCYGTTNSCPQGKSRILTVVDQSGDWAYMQITGYNKSNCGILPDYDVIHVTATPGGSFINPPGNRNVNCPSITSPSDLDSSCKFGNGVSFISLRVRRDQNGIPQLQQKDGIFDPNRDNPGNDFTPLLDNIEDLQIAYIFNDGAIRNDGINELATVDACPNGVPLQVHPVSGAGPRDISNVVGLRVSVTGIANEPVSFAERAKFFRPASEDRPAEANADRFYHYRLTETVMLRNRNLGG